MVDNSHRINALVRADRDFLISFELGDTHRSTENPLTLPPKISDNKKEKPKDEVKITVAIQKLPAPGESFMRGSLMPKKQEQRTVGSMTTDQLDALNEQLLSAIKSCGCSDLLFSVLERENIEEKKKRIQKTPSKANISGSLESAQSTYENVGTDLMGHKS